MPTNHRRADFATFEALDRLPSELLREVCFAARVWDAAVILPLYREARIRFGEEGAIDWLVTSIRAGDEQDVRDFGAKYERKHKTRLPHLAAGATILRFRQARRFPRSYRLRRGASPSIRAAWAASERLLPVA